MKTALDTTTVQTILPTQSAAFSQKPIQDTNTPWGLFVGGGLLVGVLILAIAKRCCVSGAALKELAQIAATNYTKRRRRHIVPQSLGRTHTVGTSNRHSRPHSNSYRGSCGSSDSDSSCMIYNSSSSGSLDNSSSCTSYDSSPSNWSSDNSSSCTSYDSSPSNWSSDNGSSCTSYDSSSSWSSDNSSSCTSYDSSSSSSFGGGSSGGSGAGGDW
jgi:hypothetical protein